MEERYARQTMLPEIGGAGAAQVVRGFGADRRHRRARLGRSPLPDGAGVGRIGLADADTVSKSNLQRQVLYTERQIGMPKSAAAGSGSRRSRPTPRSNAGRKELPRKTHGLFWTVTT